MEAFPQLQLALPQYSRAQKLALISSYLAGAGYSYSCKVLEQEIRFNGDGQADASGLSKVWRAAIFSPAE
jgi:hypothetical protein